MAKFDPDRLKAMTRPAGMPFRISKIGHVVLQCRDLERSVRFYTEVLGFKVSDVYPDEMVPGGMVFMRCSSDHHGVGFVGAMPGASAQIELNHLAFEVATLDEVLRARDHLQAHGVALDFEGRRRAGSQIAVEFSDPDGHRLESSGGSTRSAATSASARRRNGNGRIRSRTRSPIRSRARTRVSPTARSCANAATRRSVRPSSTRSRRKGRSSGRRPEARKRGRGRARCRT